MILEIRDPEHARFQFQFFKLKLGGGRWELKPEAESWLGGSIEVAALVARCRLPFADSPPGCPAARVLEASDSKAFYRELACRDTCYFVDGGTPSESA